MKANCARLAARAALAAVICCAPLAWSQNYQVIFDFGAAMIGNTPSSPLTFDSQGNLYGTAAAGGQISDDCFAGCGTVFELSPTQSGPWNGKLLFAFQGLGGGDGGDPNSPVVFDRRGNLYGTTNCTHDCASGLGGVVFQLTPALSGPWAETILFGLSGDYCANGFPFLGVLCSVGFDRTGRLFGVTIGGDTNHCMQPNHCGTVFRLGQVTVTHWYYLLLHGFTTTSDGALPLGLLAFDSNNNIYGTTLEGGSSALGTVYMLKPNHNRPGWTETILHSFMGGTSDGASPVAGVVVDAAGNVYGTTSQGGSGGVGTVFMLTPQSNGTYSEAVLYSFQGGNDAAGPNSSLTFDAVGNLYGTAGGGSSGKGTLFKLTPTGGGHWTESIVHTFTGGTDGGSPFGGVTIDPAGNLYGTASTGGMFGQQGVAFELTP